MNFELFSSIAALSSDMLRSDYWNRNLYNSYTQSNYHCGVIRFSISLSTVRRCFSDMTLCHWLKKTNYKCCDLCTKQQGECPQSKKMYATSSAVQVG